MPLVKTEPELSAFLHQVPELLALETLCQEMAIPFYLVGGAVRDLLWKGELSQDLDITVPPGHSAKLAQTLAERHDGKWICLDERYAIYRVILFPERHIVDIADFIGATVEEDLARRDLTINAMAFDFTQNRLLDWHGGRQDLERGLIRMISADNMLDDPLRLLRIFRFGAEMGFNQIDPATLAIVETHGEYLIKAAPERIHYELMRMLSADRCYAQIRIMADTRLLEHIFPELAASRPIPANRYHHLPLYEHTLELIKQAEVHYPDFPPSLQEALQAPFNPFIKRLGIARMSCLMHDVGKPATMTYDADEDRYKFYGHDAVGADMSWCIGHRLRWGRKMNDAIYLLVRWHLYPSSLLEPDVTVRARRRLFNRLDSVMPEMMLLAMADRFSALGPAVEQDYLQSYKQGLIQLWEDYQTFIEVRETKTKLLTGHQIMELLQVKPGPQLGAILRALDEAQLNGEVTTVDEATTWLKTVYQSDL